MTEDFYAALGVSRTSEDVVIRGAYLALMRRYHPDANSSADAADAAERVRKVTTAYEVLSDPKKRANYDRRCDFEQASSTAFERPRGPPVGPFFFVATMSLLSLAVLAVWIKPSGTTPPIGLEIDATSDSGALLAEAGCIWPNATEVISRELVRQASQFPTVDPRTLLEFAPHLVVQVNPKLSARSAHELGNVNCIADVRMFLPPGVRLSDGRETFRGEITYVVRNQVGASSPKVTFVPSNKMALQLASLRRLPPMPVQSNVEFADKAPVKGESTLPSPEVRPAPFSAPQVITRTSVARPEPKIVNRPVSLKTATVRVEALPSSEPAPVRSNLPLSTKNKVSRNQGCRKYGTRWTELLCQNEGLSALDRQMGAFDAQSRAHASAIKREQLRLTWGQFSANRIRCKTEACLRQLYLARIKTVADIMSEGQSEDVKKRSN